LPGAALLDGQVSGKMIALVLTGFNIDSSQFLFAAI
jgi:hypothetical protein